MSNVVVFFKANCIQSFTAAWFLQMKYPGCMCLDLIAGENLPMVGADKRVFTVGLDFSAAEIAVMAIEVERFVVLGMSAKCERELFEHFLLNDLPDSLMAKFTASETLAEDIWKLMFEFTKRPAILDYLRDPVLNDMFKDCKGDFERWSEVQYNYMSYFSNAHQLEPIRVVQLNNVSRWHISNLKAA